ncbi:MAG: type II toxin-antitoxin system VapC family toxin [Planctomycetes bacterium]|nr:type II toxin-antitoxin system VapC family toxin [Planctomycetota bacterium]
MIVAAHQRISHRWWRSASRRFQLHVSALVIQEISDGDPEVVKKRLAYVEKLLALVTTDEAIALAATYTRRIPLPKRAEADALHIALAVAHGMDFLVTWNCAHIANGQVVRRLQQINLEIGKPTPVIVTPEELLAPLEELEP